MAYYQKAGRRRWEFRERDWSSGSIRAGGVRGDRFARDTEEVGHMELRRGNLPCGRQKNLIWLQKLQASERMSQRLWPKHLFINIQVSEQLFRNWGMGGKKFSTKHLCYLTYKGSLYVKENRSLTIFFLFTNLPYIIKFCLF